MGQDFADLEALPRGVPFAPLAAARVAHRLPAEGVLGQTGSTSKSEAPPCMLKSWAIAEDGEGDGEGKDERTWKEERWGHGWL